MRHITLLVILIISFIGTACDNETVDNAADFEFETADKESNKISLIVTIRYRLKGRLEKKLERKYGRHYKDSLLFPAISTISTKVLGDYSAGEIYNYKRDSIEQKLGGQTKTTFAEYDIEVTDFFIRSVHLSDSVMKKFEKEHLKRLNSKDSVDNKD